MNVGSHRSVGLAEAKAHLCALIAAVEAGESICITRNRKPVATVSPVATSARSIDLAWLQRMTDLMPIGHADAADLARDLHDYAVDH
jgi:prevent-host-death family protein